MGNISYFKLFLTIVLANLFTAFLMFLFSLLMVYFVGKGMSEILKPEPVTYSTPHSRAQAQAQQEALKNKLVPRSLSSTQQRSQTNNSDGLEAKRNAYKTNLEVCNFWRGEYSGNKSKYNKRMMDNSCKRARETFVY